jgi:hypothetical protein
MDQEAEHVVANAITKSEFDPDLRSFYAQILQREKRLREAVEQTQLAFRLEPSNWHYLEQFATYLNMERVFSRSLSDEASLDLWLEQYRAWKRLSEFHVGDGPTDAELHSSKENAGEMVKLFETPVGKWKTTAREYFNLDHDDRNGIYKLYKEQSSRSIDSFYVEMNSTASGQLTGTYKMQAVSGCLCDVAYAAKSGYWFTRLWVEGHVIRVYGTRSKNCDALNKEPNKLAQVYDLQRVW